MPKAIGCFVSDIDRGLSGIATLPSGDLLVRLAHSCELTGASIRENST